PSSVARSVSAETASWFASNPARAAMVSVCGSRGCCRYLAAEGCQDLLKPSHDRLPDEPFGWPTVRYQRASSPRLERLSLAQVLCRWFLIVLSSTPRWFASSLLRAPC